MFFNSIPMTLIRTSILFISLFWALYATGQNLNPKFKKQVIAFESAESVGVMDVDLDGNLDLVSGSYWYKGPEFLDRFLIGQVKRYGEYFEDFSTIAMDVNADGRMDYITGGWFEGKLIWRENPGNSQEWPTHLIAETGNIETARGWDLDDDGLIEIIPNNPRKPLAFYKWISPGKFEKYHVWDTQGHGLGFGDINQDGRVDIIVSDGWLEAPQNLKTGKWIMHPDFALGDASIPILVVDVDQDGLNDLIVGQGHDYGLYWLKQIKNGSQISFTKQEIDPFQSQFHTMEWEDLDNDGAKELITGKRYRAHNGKDPGEKDHAGLYYYKWNGTSFTKNIISQGPLGAGKGTGIYFSVKDLNQDQKLDIVVAGKDGLVVFFNLGSD